jgi:hypothetical protein
MPDRVPSPELIRFLLAKWPSSMMTLADATDAAAQLPSDQWHGFDRVQIERDLAIAMASHAQTELRGLVAPVVLYFRGGKCAGKTSTTNLLRAHGIPSYSTDLFVGSLRHPWHGDETLRRLAEEHFPYGVDNFIRTVQYDELLANSFIDLFFDEGHGFHESAPISIIEGYLHDPGPPQPLTRLDQEVLRALRKRKYRVWVLNKFDVGGDFSSDPAA